MVRNARMALLATVAVGFTTAAHAGSINSYSSGAPTVATDTYIAPEPQPYYAPAPVAVQKDGYYNDSMGNNDDFGYQQSSACGGVLDGEKCLVILNDHMRRVRLPVPAGTILVGNPAIADVTVLGNDTMFVSARTIGSTNIIALDKSGNEIVTYEVFVREPRTKRVVLRNGGDRENYQCAPNCERALAQSDAAIPHGQKLGVISSDLGLDRMGIGLQSGSNPNTDPTAAAAGAAPAAPGAGAAAGAGGGMVGAVQGLGGAVAPAQGGVETIMNIMGGNSNAGPARTSAPPAQPN